MKLVQINATCGSGSTGKICVSISKLLSSQKIENYILYSAGKSDYPLGIRYMGYWETKFQALKSRIFGNYGLNSHAATRRLIHQLEQIQPDAVHLHNLHGHNCNFSSLFHYLKEKQIKVYWTFHDCWAMTGYCTHFDMAQCGSWKTGCQKCPQRRDYSWFWDRSNYLWMQKREAFSGLDLTVITPSIWLAELVGQSFLKDYPIHVIPNGIDLNVFQPTQNNFRQQYHIPDDRKILLGVAFDWGLRKGLDVFIHLAQSLPEAYQIVLVGTNEEIDAQLPDNILSIHRTANQKELAQIYTAADLFVNPTREDTYPTVNMEALACGTPVITFRTGGSPEILDESCGVVVNRNEIISLKEEILRICNRSPFSKDACRIKALSFDQNSRFKEYVNLYGNESTKDNCFYFQLS